MIQVNELRIENLVLNNNNETSKVILITGNDCMVNNSKKALEKNANPIPLTE